MDYRTLAIDELRNISARRTAAYVCRDRLAELTGRLRGLRGRTQSTEPVTGSGDNQVEAQWLNLLAAKTDEEQRLKTVLRCTRRFDEAWQTLTDRDRDVLTEFYIVGGRGAADRAALKLRCDPRTAFRWRDEALIAFTRSFFGAVVA